jgi:phytoene dehydrogenase-like protein
MRSRYDAVVVGAGHNGLVAAAYLARAGRSVLVLERLEHVGGAAVSQQVFDGVDVRLSAYSYLVSLLPDRIVADLGLEVTLADRSVASYTAVQRAGRHTGLLVERDEGPATATSFLDLTGAETEFAGWQRFYGRLATLAEDLAPTLTEPLVSADDLAGRLRDPQLWHDLRERPLADVVADHLSDDVVRGVALTDGLIGTFADVHAADGLAGRCFLYHLIGNGTGRWRVPVGGMGAVTGAMAAAARGAGAELLTRAAGTAIDPRPDGVGVQWTDDNGQEHSADADVVVWGAAPTVLAELTGAPTGPRPSGAQLKVNMVLARLPRLRSGADPATAFAGTLHVDESAGQIDAAYAQAAAGRLPDVLPFEVYCHSLTDPSILGPDLQAAGAQTLTLFGLHMPARLFGADHDTAKRAAVEATLRSLNSVLAEPVEDCLWRDADGAPCLEARTPLELEGELGLPAGHIFHRDLAWPWAEDDGQAGRWGVETAHDRILLCGAGAIRGGGVSGIPGHNAAMAVLAA